jgi:hypothetical protein
VDLFHDQPDAGNIAHVHASEFMAAMRAEFPDLVDELDDETWRGLLHVEMGCFARYTMAAVDSGDRAAVTKCFHFARRAWTDGDHDVQNALAVSYLEHLNFADGKVPREWAFSLLAPALRAEAGQLGVAPGYRRP